MNGEDGVMQKIRKLGHEGVPETLEVSQHPIAHYTRAEDR